MFIEGFAEFVETATFENGVTKFGYLNAGRGSWLTSADWLSVDDMLTFQIGQRRADDVARFYAQSWLMVHYLFDSLDRRTAIAHYFQAIRGGADAVSAFQPAFGVGPTQFQDQLREYARHNIPLYQVPGAQPPPATIASIPPSAEDLLPLAARLRNVMPVQNRTPELDQLATQIEQTAAHYPRDPLALRTLALAQIYRGQFDQARTTLASLTQPDSPDYEAIFDQGLSYFMQAAGGDQSGSLTAARHAFVRVFHLNPRHAPTLYFYSLTYAGGDQPMNDQQLDVLMQAYGLAPQVGTIGLSAGRELMRAGQFDEAISVLGPLAESPHGGSASQYAQALLQAAKAHQPPPPEPSAN